MPFFDLQVNGYGGVDLNRDDLTAPQLATLCAQLAADGVQGFLATVITDHIPVMCRRLERICRWRDEDPQVQQLLVGFHIEGPFLNEQPGYIGAHPAHAAIPADRDAMQRLLDAAHGLTRIVTLAPERDPDLRVTRFLADQGICVSAGHCNPSYQQLRAAIDAGLTMFTHLGNGCPLVLPRHDNIIQRALSLSRHLWIGLIGDGVHVPYFALGNYLRAAGYDRCFIVTDAIAAAGLGPGVYSLGGQQVVVDQQLATWSADRTHLMGSAGTMPHVARQLADQLGLTGEQIEQLTWHNPRRALGLAGS